MKVLITGARGFVGSRLVQTLLQRSHSVVAVGRKTISPQKNLSFFPWDATSNSPINPEALEGVEALVNLMGENIASKRWSDKQKQKMRTSRIDGTKVLAESLKQIDLKTFISAGAVGYYGVNLSQSLDENSPAGDSFLSQLCKDWEIAAQSVKAQRHVRLRIGVVLGLGGGALSKMLPIFRLGMGGPIGRGHQNIPWIGIDDLVNIIVCALENSNYQGVYNAVSPNSVTNLQLTHCLGRTLGRPTIFPVPPLILKLTMGEMSTIVLDSQNIVPKRLMDMGHKYLHPDLDQCLKSLLV